MKELTEKEIKTALDEIAKKSTAPDKETPDWLRSDIKAGMKWMYERLTGGKFPENL